MSEGQGDSGTDKWMGRENSEVHGGRRLPDRLVIRRAREFRLYTADGRRFVDLYLDNGRAILGHRTRTIGRRVLEEMSRTGGAALSGRWEARAWKALSRLFPGRNIAVFTGLGEAVAALRKISLLGPTARPTDPPCFYGARRGLCDAEYSPDVWYWRPFLPEEAMPPPEAIQLPILPVPAAFGIQVVTAPRRRRLPDGGQRPAEVAFAVLTRAIADLRSANSGGEPERDSKGRPRTRGQLSGRSERALSEVGDAWVARCGPYLVPRWCPLEESEAVRRFAEKGFYLGPSDRTTLVMPALLSRGELQALAGLTGGR